MVNVEVTPHTALRHEMDVEERILSVPAEWSVYGMLFSRLVDIIGRDWKEQAAPLVTPPRGDKYIPFKAYSQRDFARVVVAAARRKHPRLLLPEAMRRLARDDFDVLATSTFGRVMLAMAGDGRTTLLKMPQVYAKLAPGFESFTASDLDASTVRLEYKPRVGFWEYQVGQWEGIAGRWFDSPVVRVQEPGDRVVRFDITWREPSAEPS